MHTASFIYEFTDMRKTFLNRDVGFYAFTRLHEALYTCAHMCACACVRTCMCVREARKCVNA